MVRERLGIVDAIHSGHLPALARPGEMAAARRLQRYRVEVDG